MEFYGVESNSDHKDPSSSFDPNTDVRTLVRPYKGDYLAVDGLATEPLAKHIDSQLQLAAR